MELYDQIMSAVQVVQARCALKPGIGLILGTGLGSLSRQLDLAAVIPFAEIPGFSRPTVDSHAGELMLGHLGGKPVVVLSGRAHVYEGYSLAEVTFPVRVAKALGIETLVVSNAAGGLNPQFSEGDLMVITDHINFMGDNPLIGPNDDRLGPRFPDMSEPYSRELIALAESVALARGIPLRRGVYLACPGPSLETGAEYRFMRGMGADAVGMSTVPEVIVAVHAGLKVLGLSVITDMCFPDALKPAFPEEIIAVARKAEPALSALVAGCIESEKM